MKADVAEIWIEALESGEYKQCHDALYDSSENSYCCLGVLTKLAKQAGIQTHLLGMYPEKRVLDWAGLKTKDGELTCLGGCGLDCLNDGKKGFTKMDFKEIAQVIRDNVAEL